MFRFDNYESCTNVKQQVGDTIPMFTTIVCEILGCLRPILLSEKYVYFVHFVFFQQQKKRQYSSHKRCACCSMFFCLDIFSVPVQYDLPVCFIYFCSKASLNCFCLFSLRAKLFVVFGIPFI